MRELYNLALAGWIIILLLMFAWIITFTALIASGTWPLDAAAVSPLVALVAVVCACYLVDVIRRGAKL